MKREEIITRNITETFDFVRYLMDTPNALDDLPDNSTIDFLQANEVISTRKSVSDHQSPSVLFKVERKFSRL